MKNILTAFLLAFSALLIAQPKPVTWSTSVEKTGDNQAWLIISATIEDGWHLYSQDIPEGGPIPTSFAFTPSADYSKKGKVVEGNPHEEYDPNFEMVLKYYGEKAVFKQKININSTSDFTIVGELEFMVCNDEMCLPPEYVDIAFKVKGATSVPEDTPKEASTTKEPNTPIAVANAAPANPVSWSTSVEQSADETWLVIKATIEEGWHLYSQHVPEEFPNPTRFAFTPSDKYQLSGETQESESIEEYEELSEMTLSFFKNEAIFRQKIDVLSTEDFKVLGELEFMTCDNSMCFPPEYVDISFDVKGVSEAASAANAANTSAGGGTEAKSLWRIFILGFLGGLAALFMPCIFPMIPLTVSFFTKQSKTKAEGIRKATIYGASIIVIYVLLGMMVSLVFGADALNKLSTNPWFNIAFFVLFVVFALSFFGAFEITLPSSWVNKADEASNKGGLAGIFFMAFTLSLVSFSCTGPIIGTLLVDAASKGEFFGPAIGMFAFALALALPFTLFAAFPGWLNSMPKSGGWLNNVKVVLGFLELAFAFKFLSTADMVLQAHYLEREMFFAIWVGIDFLLVLYLLGVYLTPNDSKVERIGVSRLAFAIVFTVFGFYLLPGIWGAPVKLVSGFPPPEHYAESKGGSFAKGGGGHGAAINTVTDASFGDHCPFDLSCFNDFDEGMAYAKKVGKPVLVDFTGWGCVNCRKMEEQVWSDPRVLSRLRENVVLISLYVDERTKLPESEQRVSEKTGRKIKNVGNKWSEFQEVNFGAVAQPYYIILGHDDMKPLHESAAYDPDIDKFIDWLDRGKAAFEASK